MKAQSPYLLSLLLCTACLAACGDDAATGADAGSTEADAGAETPDAGEGGSDESYSFDSRFEPGTSPVSKSGQAFRHVLISEMKSYLSGLTSQVDTTPALPGDVTAALNFYFEFDSTTSGTTPLTIETTPALLQSSFDDISSDKNLLGKLAGNDAATDHKDWTVAGNFVGWDQDGVDTPTQLVRAWFQQIDDMAVARVSAPELGPDGAAVPSVFLTAEGQDLQQLLQKFLVGAIGFSQGADDYLDTDVDGKGVRASNLQSEGKPYSALGHAWDEGFGYFGATIDYNEYTDDERAAKGGRDDYQGHHDTDGDGAIDVKGEYIFGHAANCGKRDRGSVDGSKTTFGNDAFEAFRAGRELILSVDGELSEAQITELSEHSDTVRDAWEKCVAATVVHYINAVDADMDAFGSDTYDFATHAKHWSELKGFALSLQFSPVSPLHTGTLFADLHDLIGTAPVLPNAEAGAISDYATGLDSARTLMKDAYNFADANVEVW